MYKYSLKALQARFLKLFERGNGINEIYFSLNVFDTFSLVKENSDLTVLLPKQSSILAGDFNKKQVVVG